MIVIDYNYVLQIESRRMRWVGHVASIGWRRGVYRVLVGKSGGKRPRHRWEDNIKMDLQEVGCGGMGGISRLAENWLASQKGLCSVEYGAITYCRPNRSHLSYVILSFLQYSYKNKFLSQYLKVFKWKCFIRLLELFMYILYT